MAGCDSRKRSTRKMKRTRRRTHSGGGSKKINNLKAAAKKLTKKARRSIHKKVRKLTREIQKTGRKILGKTKRKTKRKGTKKKRKKKLNAYMKALNQARKSGMDSFEYNGKTYYRKLTKTGMVIYGSKKSTKGGGTVEECKYKSENPCKKNEKCSWDNGVCEEFT